VRRAPSFPGSGFVGFAELYLDGRYEGYLGIPKKGGPDVVVYGRSQVPEPKILEDEPAIGDAEASQQLSGGESSGPEPHPPSQPTQRPRIAQTVGGLRRRLRRVMHRHQGNQ